MAEVDPKVIEIMDIIQFRFNELRAMIMKNGHQTQVEPTRVGRDDRKFVRSLQPQESSDIRARLWQKFNSEREAEIQKILQENPWMTMQQVAAADAWQSGTLRKKLGRRPGSNKSFKKRK